MEFDLIPQLTIRKIDEAQSIVDLVKIKLTTKQNSNFDKGQKNFVLGYASAMIKIKRDKLFA